MVNSVKTPNYAIWVNGVDVTEKIKPHIASISLTDNHKDKADELTITLSTKFQRPNYQDSIKLYLGYGDDELTFFGLFHVQSTNVRNNRALTINATSVDFKSRLKERVSTSHDESLESLVSKIAGRHGLDKKIHITEATKMHYEQDNESDLAFIQRLAKEHNAVFNIKNATLYFVQGEQQVPNISIDIDTCIDSSIAYSSTSIYASAKAQFHDTKQNKAITVAVGDGSPVLSIKGHWHNNDEAKQAAKQALERANAAKVEGTVTIPGQRIFAGSLLNLDGKKYLINKATHTISSSWKTGISFSNKY